MQRRIRFVLSCALAAWLSFASPYGTGPAVAAAVNFQGLWWNASEAGWGINFTHQGSVIFATWFTYDASGKGWWLFTVASETAVPKVYAGAVKTATGPPLTPQTLALVAGPVGIVSDSTIRPTGPSGAAAAIDVSLPVTLHADGRPDIFGCHTADQDTLKFPCRFLRPEADGTLSDITRQLLGNGPLPSLNKITEIVLGDFNRDGGPDIFVAATGFDHPPFPGETNLLLISNADGTYADRSFTLPQSLAFSHGASTADINGDGFLDIYVNNGYSPGGVGPYLLMGNGDGTFVQSHAGLPASLLSRNEIYDSCQFADIDGDGFPDLVLGANGGSRISVVL